jgi:DNA-binding NarL/FixJ family response regulator
MFLREELSKDSEYKSLSPRELEVLRCIWDGLHSKEISERLDVNRKGVEFHRRNLIKKWQCDNIMQVIRLALRRRVLEI